MRLSLRHLRSRLHRITLRGALRQGLGFVPGGTLVGRVGQQFLAGDPTAPRAHKRVARKVQKVAAKHGAHAAVAKQAKHKGIFHVDPESGARAAGMLGSILHGNIGEAVSGELGGLMKAHGGGDGMHRHRRINPANAKALRRSMRRLEAFSKLAHRVMVFKTHHHLKHKGRRK